ncbi:MCE family protein [Nocardioides sp.]|uniref:MCE family protein n=1 Tax=Nocardioides sp. TaxID=35761 RepID=UPI00260ABDF3|nr:MCE family protein [Nocardioides sp.]
MLLVLGLLVAAGIVVSRGGETVVEVSFSSAEGLYEGDDVRVLGVPVGTISRITPGENGVQVQLTIDDEHPIPADARAAIVSPSLVSGRFVQLEPVYTAGPTLEDGAEIGLERTAVPVTFDDVKQQLTDLTGALGPRDQRRGALARTLVALDKNLKEGNSTDLRRAIAGLRTSAAALSDPRSDLFTTVENLDTFTRSLALNDQAVRGFAQELDAVGEVLERNRFALTAVLRDLTGTLRTARGFLDANGTGIATAVRRVNLLSAALADRSDELAGSLHLGTNALINLANIVEGSALKGRATLSALDSLPQLLCGAILGAGGTAEQCADLIGPILSSLGLDSLDQGLVPGINVGEPGDGDDLPVPGLAGIEIDLLQTLESLLTGSTRSDR